MFHPSAYTRPTLIRKGIKEHHTAFRMFLFAEWTTLLQFISPCEGLWSHRLPSLSPEPWRGGNNGDTALVMEYPAWQRWPRPGWRQKASQSVQSFPLWNEQDSSLLLCNTAPLLCHRWLPLPSTSCMEDGLGQNFPKHSHLFHKEHRHLVPCPQRHRGSKVTSSPRGHQMPRSHCGLGPEDLNLIQQLIRSRSPRHFWKFYLS